MSAGTTPQEDPPEKPAGGAPPARRRSSLRYGDFLSAVRLKQRAVSYNLVFAHDRAHPRATRLRLKDLHRLLTPYVSVRFVEQIRAVLPLAVFLAVFEAVALRTEVPATEMITLGILAVMIGLMFFMEGVRYGLMPFSEGIGYSLPQRARKATVLAVAFILGAAATFAEPAIGALRAAGSTVVADRAPHLHRMLTERSEWLIAAVAIGVGLAVVVSTLRFFRGWPLKHAVVVVLVPCLLATLYAGLDPQFEHIVALAWDCGAITTGPVTVPLVLALGIGVSAASGRSDNPLGGFGIVTLASLFPPLAVIVVSIALAGEDAGTTAAASAAAQQAPESWHDATPFADAKAAARAIVPLVLFLWLVQTMLLGQQPKQRALILYGIFVALAGMTLFNIGLSLGLIPMGEQAGSVVPAAFSPHPANGGVPLYSYPVGIGLTLFFAAAVGFGATVAEPALNAMGMTVENLTDGAFPRRLLVRAVAAGVALGTTLGVCKVIFGLPMAPLLIAGYAIALALTLVSSEEYVNLAWDSAGVTTGPVTVPIVLSLGLGLGVAVGAVEGFGILAMASVGPIVSVLSVGLWIRMKSAAQRRRRVAA